MKLEYIVFRYSCEYKTLSKHHVSPYLILTNSFLVKKTLFFPQKRLTERRIRLFQTAKESLYFYGVLEEGVNERFQKLCKVLREHTDNFEIIYYHEF